MQSNNFINNQEVPEEDLIESTKNIKPKNFLLTTQNSKKESIQNLDDKQSRTRNHNLLIPKINNQVTIEDIPDEKTQNQKIAGLIKSENMINTSIEVDIKQSNNNIIENLEEVKSISTSQIPLNVYLI